MKPDRIRRIDNVISGRARDFPARLARTGLRSLEPVYRTITQLRNRSFDVREDRIHRVNVAVISIGNLTTGGTGKTPLVRRVTEWLLQWNQHPVIVSRGYGSQPGQPNDEFLELQTWLPDTPHIQNPDRVTAVKAAIQDHQATAIVLDDGFQHRRLGRDLDIVVIDATCPFGYDHLLPRGFLREPVASLSRADAVVITRVDHVAESELAAIRIRIEKYVGAQRIATASFTPGGWMDLQGNVGNQTLQGPVFGFCGIGNPKGFRQTLARLCPNVVDFRSFADHHDYSQTDVDELQRLANEHAASVLVCTVKDLVKIRQLKTGRLPILATTINTRIHSGESMLQTMIQQTIRRQREETS